MIDKNDQLIKIFEKYIGLNPEVDFSFSSCPDQFKYLKKSLDIVKNESCFTSQFEDSNPELVKILR